jgi:hypothetical protein
VELCLQSHLRLHSVGLKHRGNFTLLLLLFLSEGDGLRGEWNWLTVVSSGGLWYTATKGSGYLAWEGAGKSLAGNRMVSSRNNTFCWMNISVSRLRLDMLTPLNSRIMLPEISIAYFFKFHGRSIFVLKLSIIPVTVEIVRNVAYLMIMLIFLYMICYGRNQESGYE